MPEIVRVKIYDADMAVLWSDEPRLSGQRFPDNLHLRGALTGRVTVNIETGGAKGEHVYERDRFPRIVEVYVPIVFPGSSRVVGVVETYKAPTQVFANIRQGQITVFATVLVAGAFLYGSLFWIVRHAARRLDDQHRALEESNHELRAVQAQLLEAERMAAIGEVVTAVAHGIRNPLANIRAAAQVAALDGEPTGPAQKRLLTSIIGEVDRLEARLRELLRFVRPAERTREALDLNGVLRECLQMTAGRLNKAGLRLDEHLAPDLPRISGDAILLEQVFLSLIGNAIDAITGSGVITVTTGVDQDAGGRPTGLRRGPGHGRGHRRRGDPALPAVLHDEGQGDRPRPRHREEIHRGPRRDHRRGEPARPGRRVPRQLPRPSRRPRERMTPLVLIVEDESILRESMGTYLEHHGYGTALAESGEEGLRLAEEVGPDVAVVDIRLPGIDGLEVLRRLRELSPGTEVVIMTAHASVSSAVEAIKRGAFDYLTKPLDLEELRVIVDKATSHLQMRRELDYLRSKSGAGARASEILGESPPICALREYIERVAALETAGTGEAPTVLILGETGSGKELVARALHDLSPRSAGPFVEINCGAIPAALLEAELFGYEKGAYTDAKSAKPGLLEAADGGTLFLDEIGHMDVALQVKLLKAIEEKSVRRVGGLRTKSVNIRILAATNRDLEAAVADGEFRADLYYRIKVLTIDVPALRDRGDDMVLLARHFLARTVRQYRLPREGADAGGRGGAVRLRVAGQRARARAPHGARRPPQPRGPHRRRGARPAHRAGERRRDRRGGQGGPRRLLGGRHRPRRRRARPHRRGARRHAVEPGARGPAPGYLGGDPALPNGEAPAQALACGVTRRGAAASCKAPHGRPTAQATIVVERPGHNAH